MRLKFVSGIRHRFQCLSQSQGQVTHVLLTRSPLIQGASSLSSFDLHVLSTPPAFILSQDQTLRKCLIARRHEDVGTSSVSSHRNRRTRHKFETDKNKSLLTCLFCLYLFPKESPLRCLPRKGSSYRRGFWHLTLCTLLSSQGSDAPGFHLAVSTQGHTICCRKACVCHPRSRTGQLV
jgi:hypothetical protein